jgi:3-oxoacyl-[acyl-carrier protein] reductase
MEKINFNLSGKRVLITGSSRGIGYHIACRYLQQGSQVIFNSRSDEASNKLLNSINNKNASFIAGDVSKSDDAAFIAEKIHSRYGGLDILICNAGNSSSVSPGSESTHEWEKAFKENFLTSTNMVESLRFLLEKNSGSIVCISSICGKEVIKDAPVTYSVAKAALEAYVRGISRPLAKIGIRINSVCPGNILFPGSVWDAKLLDKELLVKNMIQNEVALNQFGELTDVSDLVLFLSSNLAKFITGSSYVVDGGQVRS